MSGLVVAIDGPAGAGKSTVAQEVARRCGLTFVDTGAIYRALALQARIRQVDQDDEEGLAELARGLPIAFEERSAGRRVLLDGEDVTADIRSNPMSQAASTVSRHPQVREGLLELQRSLARQGEGGVLEGRDIGTVVFPDADVKIFLTASAEERARRRAMDLEEREEAYPYELVLEQIKARDKVDSERAVAPLREADDAVRVDSSMMTEAEVIHRIVELVEQARR